LLQLAAAATPVPLRAQAPPADALTFEVVSIKRNMAADVPLATQQVRVQQNRVVGG
jgi:hypothetical protein